MSDSALLLENKRLLGKLRKREERLDEQAAAIADRDAKIEELASNLRVLEGHLKRLLAGRAGRTLFAEGQGDLFPEEAAAAEEIPEHAGEAPDGETAQDVIKRRHRPKSPARKTDTSSLPIEERTHELAPEDRVCPDTGLPLVPVGKKVTEEIEHQRSRLFVVRHTQIIYGLGPEHAIERQAKPRTAPLPPRPLDGSLASANLLAWILVQKYAHHLPLYRQESIFERDGLRLPRQTLCDWVLGAADLLRPIADSLMRKVRSGEIMQLDDTPIICQGGKGQGKFQAYLWTFINPEVDGVVYPVTPGRARHLFKDELNDIAGDKVGDGYSGNKAAARKAPGKIVVAGCLAHTTRKFRDALKEAPGSAQLFRKDIKKLYLIEDEANDAKLNPAARLALRKERSEPILTALFERGERVSEQYSDAGKMAEALGYLRNQRDELSRFLEDGRLPLDNNACERSIRPIAIGRRNWLFAGSVRGGEAAATIYTMIECCRLAGIDMVSYLADVLVRVAMHPAERMDELWPSRWAAAGVVELISSKSPQVL
jgi:transposase